MKKKRLFSLSLVPGVWILLLAAPCAAQDSFRYEALLDTIEKAAFYRIILPPEVVARCRQDLSDLRIRDRDGQFVPYVLRSDFPLSAAEGFSEFPILAPAKPADTSTDVQIANRSSGPVNSLLLFIRNIRVRRNCTLSGSDDRQKWFVIREHIALEPTERDSIDYFIQRVDFPASNYHYFKIIQEDKGLLPVNILRAGIATRHFKDGKYLDIPDPVITQKDSSNHHSYVILSYKEAYLIDHLQLKIQGPDLYKRHALVYNREEPFSGLAVAIDPVEQGFRIPSVKARTLVIDISNEDNMPLVIKHVMTGQLERYLLAWLRPGGGYRLLAGNERAIPPVYDLKYFVDSLHQEPAEILPGPLQIVNKVAALPVTNGKDRSGLVLWGIIILVLFLLVSLSLKMLKAIPGSPQGKDPK